MIVEVYIDDERDLAAALADRRLSMAGLGLIAFLLNAENGSDACYRRLSYRFDCGADRVRTALRELVNLGYVARSGMVLHIYARPCHGR